MDRWGPSQHPGLHSTLLLIYRRGEGACLGVYRRFSGTDSFSIRAGRTAHPQQQALCLRSAQRLTLNLNLQLQAHPAHSNLILCPTSLEQGEPETEETRGRPGGGEAPRTAGRDEGLWDTESPQKREGWDKGRGLRGVLGRGPGQETQFQGRGEGGRGGASQEGMGRRIPQAWRQSQPHRWSQQLARGGSGAGRQGSDVLCGTLGCGVGVGPRTVPTASSAQSCRQGPFASQIRRSWRPWEGRGLPGTGRACSRPQTQRPA